MVLLFSGDPSATRRGARHVQCPLPFRHFAAEFSFDEGLQGAVAAPIDAGELQSGALVFDEVVAVQRVRANAVAEADLAFVAVGFGEFRIARGPKLYRESSSWT